MKRTLVVLALLLVVGVCLSFADDAATPAGITFGAWGRLIYAPLSDVNNVGSTGVGSNIGTSWGGNPRIGFTIAGNSQYVGFAAHIGVDNNTFSITDDTQAWIKPFPGLELQIGRAFNDTLRGEADFGSYDWIRTQWVGDDVTFKRIGGQAGGAPGPQNAIVSYKAGGLFVFWEQAMQGAGPTNLTTWSAGETDPNGVYNNASFGAGYTIAGIGTIKAQKIGYADNGSAAVGQYQIAFNLSAVPNLYAEVAAFLPTDSTYANYTLQVPVYLTYKAGAASIHGLFIYQNLNGSTATTAQTGMDAGLGLDYDLGGGLGINSDVRYANKYFGGWPNDSISVLVGLVKGFSNGSVGIGVQYSTTDFAPNTNWGGNDPTASHWAVPIKMEYWF